MIYRYENQVTYTIQLRTDLSDKWLEHEVVISSTWDPDSLPLPEEDTTLITYNRVREDIRKHLQAIANATPDQVEKLYDNKEYIEEHYIPLDLQPIDVFIEGAEGAIDFESYCQRIHFLEGNLWIENVDLQWVLNKVGSKVNQLYITQKKKSD